MSISYEQIAKAEADLARMCENRAAIVAKGQSATELDAAIAAMAEQIGKSESDLLATRFRKLSDLPPETLDAVAKAAALPGLGRRGRDEVLKVAEGIAAQVRYGARLKAALDIGMIGASGRA